LKIKIINYNVWIFIKNIINIKKQLSELKIKLEIKILIWNRLAIVKKYVNLELLINKFNNIEIYLNIFIILNYISIILLLPIMSKYI